ncbi:hypothetical protein AAF712_001567 [Marasmius tenuissimus]|uniref:Tetraspanin n=1 Tax=Marasmius tenuissimus TaxID=585030 RepID=A0ABR3AC80_9AGAR|nr:hypothetical protein PM082_008358 [Marasmius tenuissimus]
MLMTGAAIVTITGWSQIMQLSKHPVPLDNQAALFFHSILFTVLAVLGLYGIATGLLRRRLPLAFYSSFLILHLFVSICAGAFVLSIVFRGNPRAVVNKCLNGAKDDASHLVCTNGVAIQKSVAVLVYLTSWLLEAYTVLVAYGFMRSLVEKANALDFSSPLERKDTPIVKLHSSAGPSVDINVISPPAPGMNVGYAFSTVDPSFGADRPTRIPKTSNYV